VPEDRAWPEAGQAEAKIIRHQGSFTRTNPASGWSGGPDHPSDCSYNLANKPWRKKQEVSGSALNLSFSSLFMP
jgi:hypothetical protein